MKKTRRIEITAIRRTTTFSVDAPDARPTDQPLHKGDGTHPWNDGSPRFLETDLARAILSSADVNWSPELTNLIDALVISDGDSARAASRLGLSRSRFYSKLRSLGLSIKNLRANLNLFRGQRTRIGHKENQDE
jgi:DNA-binding NtrC family response regulator